MKTAALLVPIALAAALPAWLAGTSSAPSPRAMPSISPASDSRGGIDEVRAEISALAERLARLEVRNVATPARAEAPAIAIPPSVEAELRSLSAQLATTRAAVAALTIARCDHAEATEFEGRELLELKPDTDWGAWEDVARAWRADREQARRSVLFLEPAEVLARFGPPTRIGREEDVLSWSYGRRAPDGGWDLLAELSLADGYVSALSMYAP